MPSIEKSRRAFLDHSAKGLAGAVMFSVLTHVFDSNKGTIAHADAVQPQNNENTISRYGSVIRLKPEMMAKYKRLHADPWPGVLSMISKCNIHNYSIYLKELGNGELYLFSYFEYTGDDFEADMKKMADDPETQRWWKETDPCQEPVATAGKDEWWSDMEEVFHCD